MICNQPKRIFILCFLFLSNCILSFSQSKTIKGILSNSESEPVELGSISLLQPKDSTMINYTVSDAKGVFEVSTTLKGSILVQISAIGYLPYFRLVENLGLTDLKMIELEDDMKLLDEVVISAVIPVQIKKDTISFNASSFKINPNDNIEDLLKKLPGVNIGRDGTVNANGEDVTKIFIDGKEFFGGDPTIVLKNLAADEISKVEIIDKKSYEAELTGVDDGNKQVVINLSLKKNKKNRGFGKFSAGMGLDDRFLSNLNYNQFSETAQASVIGKFNNINVTGSNIQGFLENADGLTDEAEDDDASSGKNLSGYLKTGVVGLNYGYEFKKKESVNADYFYNNSENSGNSISRRINLSGSNNFDYKSDDTFNNITNNHNFNFDYKNQSNKTNSFFVSGNLVSDDRVSYATRNALFTNDDNELVTQNNNQLENVNDKKTGSVSVDFNQKLQKRGRSFSIGIDIENASSKRNNNNKSFITRRLNTNNPNSRNLLTLRDEKINGSRLNFNFKYTEPLWTNNYLRVESTLLKLDEKQLSNQSRATITNDTVIEFLNYNYRYRENSYITRLFHNYVTSKLNISTGFELQDLNRSFGEKDMPPFTKSQYYVNPQASIVYKPKIGRKYRIAYKRIIKSPSIGQSTTVIDNLNPFSIRKGNPDLNTEKMDRLTFIANINKLASSTIFSSKIQFSYTDNAIIPSISIDENFVRIRSFENGGDRKQLNTYFSLSKKINSLGIRYTIKNTNLISTSNSIVNKELNDVTSKDFLVGLTFENFNKNTLDIKTGASFNINNTSFFIADNLDRTYTQQQYYTSFDYDFSDNLNFNTQFDYIVFSDNRFTLNQTLPIWNAAISYSFSRKKNSTLKLILIDLLDKNIDIYRRSTINYFEETTTESLGRYAILSFTYKIR